MNVEAVVKSICKLFDSLKEYKDFLNAIPEHKDSMTYRSRDVLAQQELIQKFGLIRKDVIVAKIGDKLYRVFGNDTLKAVNSCDTTVLEESYENYLIFIVELTNEEAINDFVEGVDIQYSLP
jgi:hypothetical protein